MYRASLRRPGGWAQVTDPDLPGGKKEQDTAACGHCGGQLFIQQIAGGCYQCGSQLCESCVSAETCLPFEAWLDATEGKRLRGRWAESFAEWTRRTVK